MNTIIQRECDNYYPIVCCFQESILISENFAIRGFTRIHLISHDIGGGTCGGVSVLVRDGIPTVHST